MTILTGIFRVGRNAELRHLPSGEAVINLSLAYNYGRKDEGGRRPTQWIDAGLWGKRAESLVGYLLSGTAIFAVLEDVHIETFNKADGAPGFKLVGRVQSIEFTGSRPADDGHQEQRSAPAPMPSRTQAKPAAAPRSGGSGFDDMDDDIPF